MTGETPVSVSLRGVVRRYEGRPVLAGVDLDAADGRLLVLLGRSGAGKSTLLRLVAGLDAPDAGRIEVGGVAVADPVVRVPAERRGIGMVFQSLELWPHMTVAENVAFGLPGRPRGRAALAHARVREICDQVGLSEALRRRRPPTLSGGERQRAAIARALAPSPRVLLYDEPLANLDPERRADVRRLVRRLRAETACTVIYVTHDAAEALEMGDEVAVLEEGRVVDGGAPEHVYAHPRTLASARALGTASEVPARVGAAGIETAFGAFRPAGRDGPCAPEPRGGGWVAVLRPEQVVPSATGAAAEVVDAHPVAGGYAFAARLAPAGPVVVGRSAARLVPGAAVRLALAGSPAFVPAEGAS